MPNVTIDNAAAGLNLVQRTVAPEMFQQRRIGLEWESLLPPRQADKIYMAVNATPSEILQPYQWAYTPKGSVSFDAVENTLRPIKADVKLTAEDLEEFWDSWMLEWFEAGRDPIAYSFPRFIYETVYMPKLVEEQNQMAWTGEYTAPTAGTAGGYLTAVDGFKKKIADAVTASDLTEIPTGALLAGSIVDQVEAFCDAIPQPYRDLPGQLIMSSTNVRNYQRNYRELFGTGNGVAGNDNPELRVDYTNKRLRPMMSMDTDGSNRIIFVPDGLPGLIWVTRRGFSSNLNIRWEAQERIVKGLGEFYRAFGATYWENVFVNDQE